MKTVYMGTPDFAVKPLKALAEAGYDIGMVFTQPDREKNRGKKVIPSPVKEAASELGLKVVQPARLKGDEESLSALREYAPDIIIVAAYGQILPKEVLELPKFGCINIHGSLLPEFRGASPVQHAILSGKEKTGVTIMQMAEGLDTGDMLTKAEVSIEKKTTAELMDELSEVGARLLTETLPLIEKRKVRAFNPWPGTYFDYGGVQLKVWAAEVTDPQLEAAPGTVTAAGPGGIDIAFKRGILKITEIQAPGKKKMPVDAFLRGNAIEIGRILQ